MQQAFQAIKRLVADFKAQEAAYLSPHYQEQQVREDFINKFFAALGWDVTHERQKNPYEQEVHIENRVRMPGLSFPLPMLRRLQVSVKPPLNHRSAIRKASRLQ